MTTHKKRERTQNWTLEEKILLLKLCEGKVDVLENKRGDQFSVATKNAAWKDIHEEFIATLGTERDVHRLKEQWQRMKAQARSEMQDFTQRLQKYGDLAKQRQPSEISEEVLKVMHYAQNKCVRFPMYSHESDDDYEDNTSERDGAPLYLCQTEVKQEVNEIATNQIEMDDSNESFLSTTASNLQNLSRVEFYNKQDFVLTALANLRHHKQVNDFSAVSKGAKGTKRKNETLDENIYVHNVRGAKAKEYEKRMEIIEEQIKTAKLHRETAEIQKQIAQQQLKQISLPPLQLSKDSFYEEEKLNTSNMLKCGTNGNEMNSGFDLSESRKEKIKRQILCEINFCEETVKYHQELLMKHRQRLAELDSRD